MRLKQTEIDAIKKVSKNIFGKDSTTLLFGSRIDDTKRGGDIDLYIRYKPTLINHNTYQLKIKFLVQLKRLIGDQKIDVLIDTGNQTQSIFKTVTKVGIKI